MRSGHSVTCRKSGHSITCRRSGHVTCKRSGHSVTWRRNGHSVTCYTGGKYSTVPVSSCDDEAAPAATRAAAENFPSRIGKNKSRSSYSKRENTSNRGKIAPPSNEIPTGTVVRIVWKKYDLYFAPKTSTLLYNDLKF